MLTNDKNKIKMIVTLMDNIPPYPQAPSAITYTESQIKIIWEPCL
jgi:hypothetical protein